MLCYSSPLAFPKVASALGEKGINWDGDSLGLFVMWFYGERDTRDMGLPRPWLCAGAKSQPLCCVCSEE